MFRTNRMSEDINWIYIILLRKFPAPAAKRIMINLLMNRTYNIQLVGATGVGKSCFAQRLLRNTFSRKHTGGAIYTGGAFYTGWSIKPGSISFPTSLGKIDFNISECRYLVDDANLYRRARDEWENIDAFFVMTSHQDRSQFQESKRWIQAIRRVRGDVPIVFVELKCDRRGRHNLQQDIQDLCTRYGNIQHVQVSSKNNTNILEPLLALQDILRTSARNLYVNPNISITPLLIPPPPPAQPAA